MHDEKEPPDFFASISLFHHKIGRWTIHPTKDITNTNKRSRINEYIHVTK